MEIHPLSPIAFRRDHRRPHRTPVQLNLQTRAGFDDDPKTFFIFDDLGRLVEVDEETYFDSPRVV